MNLYEKLDIILSAVNFFVSAVLTIFIILQTNRLNKKQQKLDKALNESQRELQQRQLKLDLYNYRRDVYVNLANIYEFTKIANIFMFGVKKDIYSDASIEAKFILEIAGYIVKINNSDISSVLAESNFLFSDKVSNQINFIYHEFLKIWITLNQLSNKNEKNKEQQELNNDIDIVTKETVDDLKYRIDKILKHKDVVMNDIKSELDVSNLEK